MQVVSTFDERIVCKEASSMFAMLLRHSRHRHSAFAGQSLLAVIILLVGALLTQPAPAAAQNGLDRSFSADAFWSADDGCVNTFVGIYPVFAIGRGSSDASGPSGPPSTGTSVSLQIERWDLCTSTPLLRLQGGQFLPEGAFEIDPGLAWAALHATGVVACDSLSGACVSLSISLDYRRIGGRGACTEEGVKDGVVTTYCNADVTGTVSDGTTNFTPTPGSAVFQMHQGFTG
jgi:hypothetical protein